jgi:hypothetical protein
MISVANENLQSNHQVGVLTITPRSCFQKLNLSSSNIALGGDSTRSPSRKDNGGNNENRWEWGRCSFDPSHESGFGRDFFCFD